MAREPYTASKILGHSTITTTQRYAHLEVGQQAGSVEKGFWVIFTPEFAQALRLALVFVA